ncbi:anthrone oxygenase family protein [Arenibacterium sp. CAU 1754]
MSPDILIPLIAGAAILNAIVAGVFLTFSDFVMKSLSEAPPATGIETMQLINRRVYRSVFLVLLLGMAPVSVAIALLGLPTLPQAASRWLILGATLYVIGVLAVTMVCNVPMNKRLDRMINGSPDTDRYWATYLFRWTLWNHLRTAASGAAAACFVTGAVLA